MRTAYLSVRMIALVAVALLRAAPFFRQDDQHDCRVRVRRRLRSLCAALVRHSRLIPGNPNIIIQYLRGGGGIVAANNLYELAYRDGTGMGMLPPSTFLLAAEGGSNEWGGLLGSKLDGKI